MRLMTSLLMAGFLVACGDKDADDTAVEAEEVADIKINKDAIIETVAEAVLNERKPISVVDDNNNIVGTLHASHVINVLFGKQT